MAESRRGYVSISKLLHRLSTRELAASVKAEEVAAALALVFTDSVSPVQLAILLWALHTQEGDYHPKVLTACAEVMREAAAQVDGDALREVVRRKGRVEGGYAGGLVCPHDSLFGDMERQTEQTLKRAVDHGERSTLFAIIPN